MNPNEISKLNAELESKSPEAALQWALKAFGDSLRLASSFGAEDMVLIDMASSLPAGQAGVAPGIRVFTLDTGRLPEETYQLMDAVRRKYGLKIEAYFPDAAAVEKLTAQKGFYSFRESVENRIECCYIRKVEPLKRALVGAKAWVTGLRRDQAQTRKSIAKAETDEAHGGILKINPLADWTEARVWEYIKKNKVPYNALHDAGYPSIGCSPCTRAVKPGEDARSGRWWWERAENKECGLHPPTERGL